MAKNKNSGYGFDVGSNWAYPEGKDSSTYGVKNNKPRQGAPSPNRGYGYNPEGSVKKAIREDRRAAFLKDEEEKRLRAQAAIREEEAARRREEEARARAAAAERRKEAARRRLEAARKEEARRRLAEEREKAARRRRRRHMGRVFRFHFKVALVACAIGAVLFGILFNLKFYNNPDDISGTVAYYYGDTEVSGVPAELAYSSGELRFDFIKAAEYLGFSAFGDSRSMRFVAANPLFTDSAGDGSESYIEFIIGTKTVVVNGTPLELSAPSRYEDDSLWVSVDVVDYFSSGIILEAEGDEVRFSKVNVLDDEGEELKDDNGEYVYETISLRYKKDVAPVIHKDSLLHSSQGGAGTTEVNFISDLSDYEMYMNPADNTEFLILVNKENSVDSEYVPNDLRDIADTRLDDRATQRMREYASKALKALFIEMRAAGYTDVSVTSAYRSYNYQEQLFNGYLKNEKAAGLSDDEAMEKVLTYSAYPGTSEHQTGLCCDMHNLGSASVAFAEEEVYEWLCDNAWKFGFILRYPEDKTDVTGYSFEPWHYRYVGRAAAEVIHEEGLCLEEYLEGLEE